MKNNRIKGFYISLLVLLISCASAAYSQTYDTISNWDGITPSWYVSNGISEVVANPAPGSINPSAHCFRVVSDEGMYEYMITDLETAVNFDSHPRYRLKVLAPLSGGDITLKFENYNNTSSHEIVLTPVPGQWTDLVYDFSGLDYNELTRMVIFWDFEGTASGIDWFIDDILGETPGPVELESNLPIVVINTFGVSIPDEPKISGHMGIIDNGPGELNNLNDPFNDYDGSIGIETRGQSTQMFPKKSYALETRDNSGGNLDVSLLGMPAENDWILYAPYTDKSLLRNVVTFDMGHKMGDYCTRTIYCEVVINNDYKGIYVLEEKIKKNENRVDIATLKPDEISGNDLTGGYIIKVDKTDPDFSFGYDGWLSAPEPAYPNAMDIIFQFYYPEPDEIVTQQRAYIRNFVSSGEDALIATGFQHPETGYLNYFDAPSFVDFMLLCEISKEVDKYRYSTYFYKKKDSDGGKLFAGPAWDFNLGYGNVDYWSPGIDYTGWLYADVQSHSWSIMYWWKRMMEDPYFRDLTKTRWTGLRQGTLAGNEIHAVIDSILVLTSDAKDRNFQRWPILGQYVWPNYDWQNNTYADEVDYFEDFLFNRLDWMDANFTGSVLEPWIAISGTSNKINFHLYGDYFRSPVLEAGDFSLNNEPGGLYVQGVEYLNSSECILTVSADIGGSPDISVTLSERAINTWQNLTSNKLGSAGMGESPASLVKIIVFAANNVVHIRCDQPDSLPDYAEIMHITGQNLGSIKLEKQSENTAGLKLDPGIYFAVVKIGVRPQVHRFVVIN
ncbi:MAG: CotH kinase family protein [Bacteroidota bacterium]